MRNRKSTIDIIIFFPIFSRSKKKQEFLVETARNCLRKTKKKINFENGGVTINISFVDSLCCEEKQTFSSVSSIFDDVNTAFHDLHSVLSNFDLIFVFNKSIDLHE